MNALFLLLLFPSTQSSPTRRVLHQPLFPASPPPPPAPDQPFFPDADGSSSSSSSSQLLPPPPQHQQPPPPSPPTATKEFAIAISVGLVALGMLSALAFFIYKHNLKPSPFPPPQQQQQHQQHSSSDPPPLQHSNHGGGPAKLNSVTKPTRYHPSPDLQPLPPLTASRAVAPDTDYDSDSSVDESATFYTPQGSLAASDDGLSTPAAAAASRLGRVQIPPPPLPPPLPVRTTSTPSSKVDQVTDIEFTKLKPLHWDKVRATSGRTTVWDHLKCSSSSFQLNEDRMETLFGCNPGASNHSSTTATATATRRSVLPPVEQENSVLDPNKSQNIAILLRALNVTRDQLSHALLFGNQEALGAELLETLVKMAPTKEEEIKLKEYNGDSSKLGSAEQFLKAILDIPFAFRRVEAMLYRANFDAELQYLKNSFDTLETASGELKSSRLFLKLLEAILRAGNRMNVGTNRGDAKAFKLDTLLKLVDIKGTDGKTTLLHFVVQEIIRSEGTDSAAATGSLPNQTNSRGKESEFRRQGLQMVSGLSRELSSVKLAAGMDSEVLHGYVSKLETGLEKVRTVLTLERPDMEGGFFESMRAFLGKAEEETISIKDDERKVLMLVRNVTEYFHGNAANEEARPFRIFIIVRDFLSTLDHVCKDVGIMQDRTVMGAAKSFDISTNASLPVLNSYNISRGNNSSQESPSPGDKIQDEK